ncbi:MAG: Zinc transport system substrate-binding protein [Chlorobi bacterium OLB7]|nr:MAG: Zinc transport system substrate-binding protein [Chlorobi bacterium OLB7]
MKLKILLLLAVLLFAGCGGGSDSPQPKKLRIVTTTGMIEDAVRNIVGDDSAAATITALMGPGVDPHLYKASQQDLSLLTEADIIFYNGLHLEGKMVEVLQKLARTKPVVAVADGVDPAKLRTPPEFNGNHDPHIWFDVKLWEGGVRKIAQTLQAQDTANAARYRQHAERYVRQLDSLDRWVRDHIATIPNEAGC